ncbi:UNVERIFIED_CONTAM: hypothetical protein Cloal_0336 [Acetivibrio alkalicellulosi]
MKGDERINVDVKTSKSIGYTIFWFGIFTVLLYRWFYLNQTLIDTLDIFIVWIIASLVQFFTLATKGIPITYPFSMNKKEDRYFVFLVPLFSGILSAVILYFFKEGVEYWRILGGFIVGFLGTLLLFVLYKIIIYLWEKINTE